jgi:uncharacterized membrane protein YsdA (DUF1294 family)
MSNSAAFLITAFLVLNGVTFALFAYDKGCAIRAARCRPSGRISKASTSPS